MEYAQQYYDDAPRLFHLTVVAADILPEKTNERQLNLFLWRCPFHFAKYGHKLSSSASHHSSPTIPLKAPPSRHCVLRQSECRYSLKSISIIVERWEGCLPNNNNNNNIGVHFNSAHIYECNCQRNGRQTTIWELSLLWGKRHRF